MINIRRAKVSDLCQLSQLETACFGNDSDAFSQRTFWYFLNKSASLCLIAVDKKMICGYCIILLRKNTHKARIYSIAVHPHWRGTGLAQQLLNNAEKAMRRHGKTLLTLEVRQTNLRAQNFYKHSGYTVFATYNNYYKDGEAAVRMHKALT